MILAIFIGYWYYKLAVAHNQTGWQYAILGLVAFIGTQFVAGFIMAASSVSEPLAINGIAIVASIGVSVATYYLLQDRFKKNPKSSGNNDLLD
jgi:hypothetical protein